MKNYTIESGNIVTIHFDDRVSLKEVTVISRPRFKNDPDHWILETKEGDIIYLKNFAYMVKINEDFKPKDVF